jgi:hypothetical protein
MLLLCSVIFIQNYIEIPHKLSFLIMFASYMLVFCLARDAQWMDFCPGFAYWDLVVLEWPFCLLGIKIGAHIILDILITLLRCNALATQIVYSFLHSAFFLGNIPWKFRSAKVVLKKCIRNV